MKTFIVLALRMQYCPEYSRACPLGGLLVYQRHESTLSGTSMEPANIINCPVRRINCPTQQSDPVLIEKTIAIYDVVFDWDKAKCEHTSCSFSRCPIIVKLSPSSLRCAATSITSVPGKGNFVLAILDTLELRPIEPAIFLL